jgi:hypothetical protein
MAADMHRSWTGMSKRLDAVLEHVRQLPEAEQDRVAEVIEQRLHSLESWLAQSGDNDSPLERMARTALREHRAGETETFPDDGNSNQ